MAGYSQRGTSLKPLVGVMLAVVVLVAALLTTLSFIKRTVNHDASRVVTAQRLLIAQLDRETGLRGFMLTAREPFLDPYRAGTEGLRVGFAAANRDVRAVRSARAALRDQVTVASLWQQAAEQTIFQVRRTGHRQSSLVALQGRKQLMDRFRELNAAYVARIDARRRSDLGSASAISTAVVAALALLLGLAGLLLVTSHNRRERRRIAARLAAEQEIEGRERRYVEGRRRFSQIMQVADSQEEAQDLVKRRIEAEVPGSSVIVLNRNNSADRLEAVTPVPDDSPLRATLAHAAPRTCLALRLGQTHSTAGEERQLLGCDICGKRPGLSTCEPILVGGEMIGSLLIGHAADLREEDKRLIGDTVAYTAPVMANLRNLAIAERRAQTDSLTGLPNRRALDDTFKRMVAQAGRSFASMSILLLDLDHFKDVNDSYGHDRGDEVLAIASRLITESLRVSDFAARMGGEEFVALLPNTDLTGAATVAEKMRHAFAQLAVTGINRPITASMGVATFPDHGDHFETLLRSADRALYQAKHDGRNCVRAAEGIAQSPAPQDAAGLTSRSHG